MTTPLEAEIAAIQRDFAELARELTNAAFTVVELEHINDCIRAAADGFGDVPLDGVVTEKVNKMIAAAQKEQTK